MGGAYGRVRRGPSAIGRAAARSDATTVDAGPAEAVSNLPAMRRLGVLLVTAAALVAGACGGDSEVGGGLQATGGSSTSTCRLGECTTTTPAPATTAAPVATTGKPTAATTAKPAAAPTTAAQQAAIVIKIQSDTADGGQFDPRQAGVPRGAIVKWTNTDTVARSVEADNGAFRSPMIPPGGSWEYKASTPGTFNYHDGTRPYAVGSLVVP